MTDLIEEQAVEPEVMGAPIGEFPGEEPEIASDPLDAVIPDGAEGVPEKFYGKTVRDLADSYRNLESFLGVPPEAREQMLGAGSPLPLQGVGSPLPPDQEFSGRGSSFEMTGRGLPAPDVEQRVLELAQGHYADAYQLEVARRVADGLMDEGEALPGALEQALQQQAIKRGQEDFLRRRDEEMLLQPLMAQLAPQAIGRDVSAVLSAAPVHGISPEELTAQISAAGIPVQEWLHADPWQKEQFIGVAARQLAYDKFVRGEVAPPTATPRAPRQQPPASPGTHGAGGGSRYDAATEAQIKAVSTRFGFTRDEAVETLGLD